MTGRQRLLSLKGIQTPKIAGILDFHIPIVYRQVNRCVRLSDNDEGIIAGVLELGREFPSES